MFASRPEDPLEWIIADFQRTWADPASTRMIEKVLRWPTLRRYAVFFRTAPGSCGTPSFCAAIVLVSCTSYSKCVYLQQQEESNETARLSLHVDDPLTVVRGTRHTCFRSLCILWTQSSLVLLALSKASSGEVMKEMGLSSGGSVWRNSGASS